MFGLFLSVLPFGVEIFFSMSFSVDYVDVRWCVVQTASIEDELIQYLAIVLVLRQ